MVLQPCRHGWRDEMQRISQTLTASISDLAERYEQTLPAIDEDITDLEIKVKKSSRSNGVFNL